MHQAPRSILVASEDEHSLKLSSKALNSEGYKVFPANSENEALAILESKQVDLVVLSLDKAKVSPEIINPKISLNIKNNHIPIILESTSSAAMQAFISAEKWAAVECITKPIVQKELISKVSAMLSPKKLRNELDKSKQQLIRTEAELVKANHKLEKLQNELAKTGQLSMIGQIAAEAAHEINNPLATMRLHIDELICDLKQEELNKTETKQALEIINHNIGKVTNAVKQLRDICQSEHDTFEHLELNSQLKHSTKVLRKTMQKAGISIEENYSKEELVFYGSSNKLDQLISNLLINAHDAINASNNSHGKISITSGVLGKDKVFLQIADNGTGISNNIIEQVFEPFFTTKSKSKGAGLGLAIASRIAEEHGGKISVNNTGEMSTVFTVTLPKDRRTSRR